MVLIVLFSPAIVLQFILHVLCVVVVQLFLAITIIINYDDGNSNEEKREVRDEENDIGCS
jgi:hypothetical protein